MPFNDLTKTDSLTIAMAQVYGGDEIGALVLDTGACWTRVGWAGDDTPSETISTTYSSKVGHPEELPSADSPGHRQFGDDYLGLVRPDVDIKNPIEDSIVSDWDTVQSLWQYALKANEDSIPESPLLLTEHLWNTDANRRKAMEICLETIGVPAMYIAKSAVCSLFSSGRGSGIVVDAGSQTVAVTPVIDGLALYRPSRRSRKAGNFLNAEIASFLAQKEETIVPRYKIKSKTVVELGEPAQYVTRPNIDGITTSFDEFQISRVLEEFKESQVQVADAALKDDFTYNPRTFEFPDGHSIELGKERYELGEKLFSSSEKDNDTEMEATESPEDEESAEGETDKKAAKVNSFTLPDVPAFSTKGISQLIADSINACDVDVRANLANNIVVFGGTSLVQGFTERINQDLIRHFPALKVRIYSPGNMAERRNSAWLGGSILASLGTFHQLWVSQQEYAEVGAEQIALKRFR